MKRPARTCEVAAHVRSLPYAAEYAAKHEELWADNLDKVLEVALAKSLEAFTAALRGGA